MDILLFEIAIFLSVGLFLLPKKLHHSYTLIIQLVVISITSIWAIQTLRYQTEVQQVLDIGFQGKKILLIIDPLSAFFILVINFTVLTGSIYARGYLKSYLTKKNDVEMALHYFNFLWLHLSMLFVSMVRDGYVFLIVWELMSISSFVLVVFESEKKETIKSGLKYLIQMHIGFAFLLVGFVIAGADSENFGFESLRLYFESQNAIPLFIIFFIGFGIKAGFIPLHSWLPHAHPAAPSHVSGIMSGVMIKMGIYGILRVLIDVQSDLIIIGYFILVISLISGILGVMLAIVQHDIKKLLAYHSIENIGIIGIGIGLGIIGMALKVPSLAVLGFAGGILHILNHSLFKSLLFYSAGSVYKQTHTRYIEHLGGLVKGMPITAILFLLGAMAICGLPPFNGFISEFLIYSGMMDALQSGGVYVDITILFSLAGLALIGGLAIFCFTKIFGIMFLGTPRAESSQDIREVEATMLLPQILIAILIVSIGFFPMFFINATKSIIGLYNIDTSFINHSVPAFSFITIGSAVLVGLILILSLIKRLFQKGKKVIYGPTWGCGYTGADAKIHQYTATSYADSFSHLSNNIVNVKKEYATLSKTEIFPVKRNFKTHSDDLIESYLILKPVNGLIAIMHKMGVLQSGNIRHYVLYGLLFIVLIFCLTLLNFI